MQKVHQLVVTWNKVDACMWSYSLLWNHELNSKKFIWVCFQMSKQTSADSRIIQSIFQLVLFSLLVIGSTRWILDELKSNKSRILQLYGFRQKPAVFVTKEDQFNESCNVFEGQWVWDNVSYPLYTEKSCPYLVKQTTCQRNGRPDSSYQNWRWQPSSCDLPRYYEKKRSMCWFMVSDPSDLSNLCDVSGSMLWNCWTCWETKDWCS